MPPDEWLISRVCEEFHCRPSQAQLELDNDTGLVFTILHLRSLAAAKRELDSAAAQDRQVTMTPAIGHVLLLEAEAMKRARATPTP